MAGLADGSLDGGRRPLRFALLCDSPRLLAWQADCLAALRSSACAELVLVITRADQVSLRPRRRPAASLPLLWRLYRHFLMRRVRALRLVDCAARLATAEHLRLPVIEHGDGGLSFTDQDIATIRSYGLDFAVQFGFGGLGADSLEVARHGVWRHDHGQDPELEGCPIGVAEVLGRRPTTTTALRRMPRLPGGDVPLHRVTVATHWNAVVNYDRVVSASVDACPRACRDILVGDDPARGSTTASAPSSMAAAPSNLRTLRLVANQIAGFVRAALAKQFHRDEWNVGLVAEPIESLLQRGRPARVTWLGQNQRDTFLADPIVLEAAPRCRFLAEHFDYGGDAKGSIVRCTLEADGRLTVSPFLDAECHLSYPFVIHHGDRSYLIPETSELDAVLLYPIGSDGVLGPAKPVMAGTRVVDATVARVGGRWWLFCGEESLRLLAFHADRLEGPWLPHRLNPLKTDVTCSRPAGPLFERGGALFRPAQDCSRAYGVAVVVHRIVQLSPERFVEVPVARIEPEADGPYPEGLHTLSVLDQACLIDGRRTVFDPTWIVRGRSHGREVRARRARLSSFTTRPSTIGPAPQADRTPAPAELVSPPCSRPG